MSESLSFDLIVRDHSDQGLNKFAKNVEKAGSAGKGLGRHVGAGFDQAGDSADRNGRKVGVFGRALSGINRTMREGKGAASGLVMAAAGLGPAILPIAGAAIPAVAGLGAAFAGAGASGKLFAAVVGSAFNEVKEDGDNLNKLQDDIKNTGIALQEARKSGSSDEVKAATEANTNAVKAYQLALAQLPPEQRRATSEYRMMAHSWQSFVDQNKPTSFAILQRGYKLITTALGEAQPLFDVASDAAVKFLRSLQGWADGGGLKGMVDFLATQGALTLSKFQIILGNLATGLGGLFKESSSSGQGILDWLVGLSEKVKTFGQGGGWERFVASTTQNGPMIAQTLGNLATSVGTIVQAVAPFAPISLAIASGLTAIIAAMPPEVLTALVGGWLLYSTATKAYAIAQGIATVATNGMTIAQKALNLAMKMNPLGLVITAILLIGTALVVAYKKSETFRRIVDAGFKAVKTIVVGTWNTIKAVAGKVFGWISDYIRFSIGNWKTLFNGAKAVITTVWNFVKDKASSVFKAVTGYVSDAVTRWKNLFNTVKDKARSIVDGIKNLFSKQTLFNAGKALINGLADGIRSVINKPVEMVQSGLNRIKGMLPGSPIQAGPLLSWNNGGAGKRLMDTVATGIKAGGPRVQGAMASALKPAAAMPATMAAPAGGLVSRGTGGDVHVHVNGSVVGTPEAFTTMVVKALNGAKANGYVVPSGTFAAGTL